MILLRSRVEVVLWSVNLLKDVPDASTLSGGVCVVKIIDCCLLVAFTLSSFLFHATFSTFVRPFFCLKWGRS